MQRLTREDFLAALNQAKEDDIFPAKMDRRAQEIHKRHAEIEWQRTLTQIDESYNFV